MSHSLEIPALDVPTQALRTLVNGIGQCVLGLACGAGLVFGLRNFPVGTGALRNVYFLLIVVAAGFSAAGVVSLIRTTRLLSQDGARALVDVMEQYFPELLDQRPAANSGPWLLGLALKASGRAGLIAGLLWYVGSVHPIMALGALCKITAVLIASLYAFRVVFLLGAGLILALTAHAQRNRAS